MSWIRCSECGREHSVVRRLLLEADGAVVRWRHCMKCGAEFETVEVVAAVVRRQAFQATLWNVLRESRELVHTEVKDG